MNEYDNGIEDPQIAAQNEQMQALYAGARQGQEDVEMATSGGLDDVKLDKLVKEYVQQSGMNLSVADIMDNVSNEELRELLEEPIRKAKKLKDINRIVGKVLGALTKERDGEISIIKRLQSLTKMERAKLLKELKDLPQEKYDEIIAVAKSFAPVALGRARPEYSVMYLKFINGIFRKKDYLIFGAADSNILTPLEEDLKYFAKYDLDIIRDVFIPTFQRAFEELNSTGTGKTIGGIGDLEKIEERIRQVIPDLNTTPSMDSPDGRKEGSITEMIMNSKRRTEGGMSFELQRVAKLHTDLGSTLITEKDGLVELEGGAVTIDGVTYNSQSFDRILGHFSKGQESEWFKGTRILEKYMKQLESARSGVNRDAKAEEKIAKLKSIMTARNALDLLRNSGNIMDTFLPMYERHFSYEIAREKGLEIADASLYESLTEEQKIAVAERTATKVREAVLFTVSNIYRNYLSSGEDPKEGFRATLQHAGDPYMNPTEMFKQFTNMLTNLVYQAKQVKTDSVDFTVLSLGDMKTIYNPALRKNVTTFTSQRVQKRGASAYDFMKELLATVKTDDGFFEAGHEYRYLSNMGSPDQTKSFFGSIGEHLRYSMTAENIDRIYSMENAGDIVRVASIIEAQLEKRMAEKGWLNEGEGKMFEEIFLNKGEGGSTLVNYILNYLKSYYPSMPEWQRQRVMQHAFTIVFAGRFRFQQIYSYANPTRGFQGQAEDKQMFNSVFSPFHKLLRFPPEWKHDFALKGALWNPRLNMPGFNYDGEGPWDAAKMGKEGFGVFNKGDHQRFGRLAWDMTRYFHDDVPYALGPTNELKVGGYDTLRGWRRYANLGVIDTRLYKQEVAGGMPKFAATYKEGSATKQDGITRLWKSIENVGSNEVLAFIDGDISSFFSVKDRELQNKEALEGFIRHLYRRYFSPSNPFSKLFPHNFFSEKPVSNKLGDRNAYKPEQAVYYQDENDFIEQFYKRVNKLIDEKSEASDPDKAASTEIQKSIAKPMMMSAMLCMVAERSPTAIMNRIKPQDEQNGLTLNAEIRNEYWKNESSFMRNLTALAGMDSKVARILESGTEDEKSALKMSYWDTTENDLIDVQSELRAEVDEEILANRSKWQKMTGGGNIFGESFDQLKSSVNGGKGYVLDDETLIRLMIKKERPELAKTIKQGDTTADIALLELENSPNAADRALALRIRRVSTLRNDIIEKLAELPGVSEDEKKLESELLDSSKTRPKNGLSKEDHYKAERLLVNKAKRVSRMRWFQKMLDERFLGSIPFMVDNSEIHKTFLNADNTMVYRSTGDSGVAEQYKMILDPRAPEGGMSNMLVMMKDAARKGDSEWGKLKSLITGFRKICSDEIGDGEVFMPVVLGLVKLQLTGFTNKQEVRNALGRWKMVFDKKGQSLFSEAYTNFEHKGFDAIAIRQYLMLFCKVNAINPEDMEKFADMFQASWFGVAKEIIPEYLTYIISYILVSYVVEAAKKEIPK